MLGVPFRLVALVLANLVRLVQNLFRLLRGRPRWVHIALHEPLTARPARLGPFRRRGLSLASLAEASQRICADASVAGVIVELHALGGGWVQAQSLRGLFHEMRAAGKRVVVHLSSPTIRQYYVACAADTIYMDESGFLALRGLAAEATFFGGALEKIGAKPELAYRGAYKSFAETVMRRDMSDAHRESLDAILDVLQAEIASALAERHLPADLALNGPYSAARAAELRLIDGVAYADEVAARLAVRAAPLAAYLASGSLPWVAFPLHRRPRRLVVLPLHGSIVGGEGGGRTLGCDAAERALAGIARDPSVVAVVLHVDSRGGSAPASDRIWHAVKRVAAKIPVVAYLDEVAASGGYYLALGASQIVAATATLTGSVGVVAGKISLAALYEKVGLASVVLARGPAAGMDHVSKPYTEEEKVRLRSELDEVYRGFVQRVADGRKMSFAEADAVAQGRVWIGKHARERGLIDALGDFDAARKLAESLAKRKPERVVEAALAPRRRALLSRLAMPAALADALAFAGERTILLGPAISVE